MAKGTAVAYLLQKTETDYLTNMKALKKIAKTVVRLLSIIVGALCIYLIAAAILSKIPVDEEKNVTDEMEIHILTNGVHTDIVVPTVSEQKDWREDITHLQQDSLSFEYLALGWGDKGFYLNTPTWSQLKASTAVNACFGFGGTAMHATYYKEMHEGKRCKKIKISKEQYARLIKYLEESFQKDASNKVLKIKSGPYNEETDAFYEGNGRYSALYTCNSWANSALKSCGRKACYWTALQQPIFKRYE